MLRYIPAKLRNLDFRLQATLLECRIQNLTQRDFQSIHQVGNRTLVVVNREVDEAAVDELFIRNFRLRCIEECLARIIRQPLFSIIRAFLVECHVEMVVAFLARMDERDHLLMLEIFLELFSGACAQTFIIFRVPTCGDDRIGELLLPCFKLAVVVKEELLCAATCFQNRRIHESDETRYLRERRPLRLEKVDSETLDMRAI